MHSPPSCLKEKESRKPFSVTGAVITLALAGMLPMLPCTREEEPAPSAHHGVPAQPHTCHPPAHHHPQAAPGSALLTSARANAQLESSGCKACGKVVGQREVLFLTP